VRKNKGGRELLLECEREERKLFQFVRCADARGAGFARIKKRGGEGRCKKESARATVKGRSPPHGQVIGWGSQKQTEVIPAGTKRKTVE